MTDLKEARKITKEICTILEDMTAEQKVRVMDIMTGIKIGTPFRVNDNAGQSEKKGE